MTQPAGPARANLSALEDSYEIRSAIRRDATSAMYLARHREQGQDVVITVVHVPGGKANDTLTHFTWDARLLATLRHDNVVRVLEGRWLDADTFAVVHVLARGSTLGEVLSAEGPQPCDRVARTLSQASDALDWARTNGIAHRQLDTDAVAFQHGTGQVRLTLGLTPLEEHEMPDSCSDARTLGMLAWSMLAGLPYESTSRRKATLAELRPDLDPAILAETHAMLECQPGGPRRDAKALIGLLAAPTVPAAHLAPPYPMPAIRLDAPGDAAPVVASRTFAPTMATFAMLIALALFASSIVMEHRRGEARVAASGRDTMSAPGEIAGESAGGVETAPMNQPPPTLPPGGIAARPPVAPPIVAPPTTSLPLATDSLVAAPIVPGAPRSWPFDSGAASTDPCGSPAPTDQRRCFDAALARVDSAMNVSFDQTVVALRQRSGVGEGAEDPPSVVQLRVAQRRWLAERDTACRQRGEGREGALWATSRADCFAELATQRVRELGQIRDRVP